MPRLPLRNLPPIATTHLRHRAFASSSRALAAANALVLLEHRAGVLQPASLNAVAAAHKLGGTVTGLLTGSAEEQTQDAATNSASKLPLSSVLYASNSAFQHQLVEPLAPVLADFIKSKGYTHVLAAHSSWGKNLFPRIAALLDVAQVSDIMAVESEDTFVRPVYAGNAIATVRSKDPIKLVTVRATAFEACAQDAANSPSVEELQLEPKSDVRSATWVSEAIAKNERPDLGSAARVVSGGRALKTKDTFDGLLQPLADALGAAIGASRAAVDGGLADNSLQVGQTGKVVAPELYIAVGISGAIQHLAGMQDSKVIVAINKDADCPIMGVADYGLVGDIFQILPELTDKIKAASSS